MITHDDIDAFEARFGVVPKVVSRLIRPTFIAAPGKTLVWSDWSAIEARVLPWLSGAPGEVVLDVFRKNDADPSLPDIYKIEAGHIFDKDPATIGKGEERQTGKVSVLALGFGGGVGALDAMAAGYGLSLDDGLKAHIVDSWRANNQWAVAFWNQLMNAFNDAWRTPDTEFDAGRVTFVFRPDYLYGTMFMFMPDGRAITYAALKREKVRTTDKYGDVEETVKVRYTSGYKRKSIWHGTLAENATQGFAASLLRDAIVRLRPSSLLPVVGHTHDEIVVECVESAAEIAGRELTRVMTFVPTWARGLPLVAETTTNWYYSKAA